MAIETETVVIKVVGETDGAVRATERLAESQKKLSKEVTEVSKAMSRVPAAKTTGMFGQIKDSLQSAGLDVKTFSNGLKDIGKGLTFDIIRTGLKGLNTDLNTTAKSALSAGTNGAAMGAAFGGPLGAAIGGAAGALVGLIRHTDQQTEASKKAAAAAREHAAALKLVAQGETTARGARRDARQELELAIKDYSKTEDVRAAQIKKYGYASEGANADSLRARRAKEDAEDARDALNKLGGDIWLKERQQYRERERAIEDITEARKRAYITNEQADKMLAELNKTEEKEVKVLKEKKKELVDLSQLIGISGYDRSGVGNSQFSAFSLGERAGINVDERALLDTIEKARTDDLTKDWNARLATQQGRKNTFLESTFGKIEDFNAYAEGFNLLTGAVTASMDAWIDGSVSAGEALKKFFADALKGLASQMAVEALKHGAYALGSLAFGDVRGAGQHAAAAAAFGVGAAAAAAAAKGLGGGTQAAGAGASSGGASAGGGGSSFAGTGGKQGPGERIIVVMGDSFSRSSPRMQQLEAERTVDLAFGGNGVSNR